MGVCTQCSRALPPNQRCLYCGSPEFMGEGDFRKRGAMDWWRVAIKRTAILAVLAAIGWFLFYTAPGKETVTWLKALFGK